MGVVSPDAVAGDQSRVTVVGFQTMLGVKVGCRPSVNSGTVIVDRLFYEKDVSFSKDVGGSGLCEASGCEVELF
jgi:hypothetical protein